MSAFSYAASSGSLMNILGSSPTPAGYSAGGSTLPAMGGAVGGAAGTSWTSGEALMMGGSIMSIFGAVNSAIGSFYAADSQKTQLKMQAQNQRFQAQMSAINARGAEMQAQQTLLAGERAVGQYTIGAGQKRASATASMAARGIQGGVGSAREVTASMDLIKEIDKLTISSNAVRQAEAARAQRINYINQGVMAGTSANNLMATAGTISPYSSSFSSLLGSASSIGSTWATQRRMDELIAAQSQRRF